MNFRFLFIVALTFGGCVSLLLIARVGHIRVAIAMLFDTYVRQESLYTTTVNFSTAHTRTVVPVTSSPKRESLPLSSKILTNESLFWEHRVLYLAKENVANNSGHFLILTVANDAHYEFVMNWIYGLFATGQKKFLVLCIDPSLYEKLLARNLSTHTAMVPDHWIFDPIIPTEAKWPTAQYNNLLLGRTMVVLELLRRGFTIFFSDVDTVWLSPHVLSSIDYNTPKHVGFVHMVDEYEANFGFYIARPLPVIVRWFEDGIRRQISENFTSNDQLVMNYLWKANGIDKLGVTRGLDPILFANTRTYYSQQKCAEFGIGPWVYHANYIVGKKEKYKALAGLKWYFEEKIAVD